jgi:hypothetical protein
MLRKRKEAKTCHECGLEALEECESNFGHMPSDESLLPCSCCTRNPKLISLLTSWRSDFFSEQWTRDSDRTAIIETPTPHEVDLLRTLHLIVTEQTQKSALSFHGSF